LPETGVCVITPLPNPRCSPKFYPANHHPLPTDQQRPQWRELPHRGRSSPSRAWQTSWIGPGCGRFFLQVFLLVWVT